MDPYSNEEMVCIGGVLDGRRAKAYGPVMEAVRRVPVADFNPSAKVEPIAMPDRDIYRREQITFGDGFVIRFWRLDTMAPHDAVSRVFANYKP